MKYTTKKSKVEEIVIDLEDGCILKLTKDNVIQLNTNSIYDHYCYSDTKRSEFSHYEIQLYLKNGLSYEFKTLDKQLFEDLHNISYT